MSIARNGLPLYSRLLAGVALSLIIVSCGGKNQTCASSNTAESDCQKSGVSGGENDEFRRWGTWARDYNGDGIIDRVNGWNDCGAGGSSEGHPGTLDCPEGTISSQAEWWGIMCVDGDFNITSISC